MTFYFTCQNKKHYLTGSQHASLPRKHNNTQKSLYADDTLLYVEKLNIINKKTTSRDNCHMSAH